MRLFGSVIRKHRDMAGMTSELEGSARLFLRSIYTCMSVFFCADFLKSRVCYFLTCELFHQFYPLDFTLLSDEANSFHCRLL